jgi:hypothetical protein
MILEQPKIERPKFIKENYLIFLDDLRKSGITNMFGAVPYIQKGLGIKNYERAKEILIYWMHSFSERHPKNIKKEEGEAS